MTQDNAGGLQGPLSSGLLRMPANLSEETILSLLSTCSTGNITDVLTLLLRSEIPHSKRLVDGTVQILEERECVGAPEVASLLLNALPLTKGHSGDWVVARLLSQLGRRDDAIRAYTDLTEVDHGPRDDAFLNLARLYLQEDNSAASVENLRRAVSLSDDYSFLTKASKILSTLRKKGPLPGFKKVRVAMLSSSTVDLHVPIFQTICFREGLDAEVYVGPYGNFRQEILNSASGLYKFAPEFVIIMSHWRDVQIPLFGTPESDATLHSVVEEYRVLWKTLLSLCPARIIQHNFDLPHVNSLGHLGARVGASRNESLKKINAALKEQLPESVAILDCESLSGFYGTRNWNDDRYWHVAKQHPSSTALPILASHQVSLIRAGLGLTKKLLILDLDNTLWGGVIGEDGIEQIRLGPPSPAGEAYQAFHRYLLELKARGVLLAVCSKNNDQDAKLPFLKHDASLLKLDDFVVFTANWDDKPTNIRRMASVLNLGIDSFVFMDDNPVERSLVRRELPEVTVPEVSDDPVSFIEAIERGRFFEAWVLSEEDKNRHSDYRANLMRNELKTSSSSLDDFLKDLKMTCLVGPFNKFVLSRITQLVAKTNQFNLTTKRYTEEELLRIMNSHEYWTQYFKLSDRFGQNGIVGLMIAKRSPDLPRAWEIDTWLMSCRVIGRQMEECMLRVAALQALDADVLKLIGEYIPTKKNSMVSDLYSRLGFSMLDESESGTRNQTRYILDLESQMIPNSPFISVEPDRIS